MVIAVKNNKDNKSLTFQLNFVYKAYLMHFVLMSREKYVYKEMSATFQSIEMLLVSLTY